MSTTCHLHEIALKAGVCQACEAATVCDCGHTGRMHNGAVCRACSCNRFALASNPQAAILAGMSRKRAAVDAANEARRRHLEAVRA